MKTMLFLMMLIMGLFMFGLTIIDGELFLCFGAFLVMMGSLFLLSQQPKTKQNGISNQN